MKRILHIIPYGRLYPPMNGGQLRCFHLMNELSKHYRLDVLCYQPIASFADNGYVNKNITFYNPSSFVKKEGILKYFPSKLKNALRYRVLTRTLLKSATLEVLEFSHIIKKLSRINTYDMVLFEHLSAMSLLPVVKKYISSAKYVLDAHNVDHLLIDRKKQANESLYNKIKKQESTLYKKIHEFWACSQHDVQILEALNNHSIKGKVVPNGVDVEDKKFVEDKRGTYDTILFCGTLDAYPNKEGLLWFYNKVWPKIVKHKPDVRLLVVGKGNRTPFSDLEKDATINFIGEVDDVAPYYKKSFIAIVPLLSGSGTRLKILEAMSFGNPIITTSKGIEGIDFKDSKHALLADNTEDFYKKIVLILDNPEKGKHLRTQAIKLVEANYDWKIIVRNLTKELEFFNK